MGRLWRFLLTLGLCACNSAPFGGTPQAVSYDQFSTPSQSFSIQNLGTVPGAAKSWANAVNDAGVVAGLAGDGNQNNVAVKFINGSAVELSPPNTYGGSIAVSINSFGDTVGGVAESDGVHAIMWPATGGKVDLQAGSGWSLSSATSINDARQIVGTGAYGNNLTLPFEYANGRMSQLPIPSGETIGEAFAVNKEGVTVGLSEGSSLHATLYHPKSVRILGPPDKYSIAISINNQGHVTGLISPLKGGYAFFFDGKTFQRIARPAKTNSCAGLAINNSDDITVDCRPGGSFIYRSGRYIDVSSLLPANSGWTDLSASAMSDNCRIVGTGLTRENGRLVRRAFEMVPPGGTCPAGL